VKPSIGGSSHGVRKFDRCTELDALNEYVTELLRSKVALVQRFEPTVETLARAFADLHSRPIHPRSEASAVQLRNTPIPSDFDHFATSAEIAFALQVLTVAGARDAPFARVDLLPSADGLL